MGCHTGSAGCLPDGKDSVAVPSLLDLSRMLPGDVTLIKKVKKRDGVFQMVKWPAGGGYPSVLKDTRVAFSPDGVRWAQLELHRHQPPPKPLLGVTADQLDDLKNTLTTAKPANGLVSAPGDTAWGPSLLARALQNYVALPSESGGEGKGEGGSSPLEAMLASHAIATTSADGSLIEPAKRKPTAGVKIILAWLGEQLDLLPRETARELILSLGRFRDRTGPTAEAPTGTTARTPATTRAATARAAAATDATPDDASPDRFAPGGDRDGCEPGTTMPQQGPCVIRHSDFAEGADSTRALWLVGKLIKYWLTLKGPISMESMRRKLDEAQSEYKPGWNPPLIHTREAGNRRLIDKHALAIVHTLLVRCGPSPQHWWSCINLAAVKAFARVKSFVRESPTFKLHERFLDAAASQADAVAEACAEGAWLIGLSRMQYNEWRFAFHGLPGQCPPWKVMRATQHKLLAGIEGVCTDSKGVQDTVNGAVCDPGAIASALFGIEHLVDGVVIPEDPGRRYGLVFDPQPFEMLIEFQDQAVVDEVNAAARPRREALRLVSEAAFGDDSLLQRHPEGVEYARLGWSRTTGRRTAILTIMGEADRNAIAAAVRDGKVKGSINTEISNHDAYKNVDGLVLFSIVTSTAKEAANMGTQVQMCFHIRGMRHSDKYCFPFAFYGGDDDYPTYKAHARTPPPTRPPNKYRSLHEAIQDLCNSPFVLKDGRAITVCAPFVPDYKAAGKLTGIGKGPRSKWRMVNSQATPATMGAAFTWESQSESERDVWVSSVRSTIASARAYMHEHEPP